MKRKFLFIILISACIFNLHGKAVDFSDVQSDASYEFADGYGLVSQNEAAQLEEKSRLLVEKYDTGICFYIAEDMAEYGYADIAAFAEDVFDLMCRDNTILLVMSMSDRDFDICCHGDYANYAFTDYGKEKLGKVLVSYLKDDQWYEAFDAYLDELDRYLEAAANGTPIDVGNSGEDHTLLAIVAGLVLGFLIALLVCLILKRGMKSVKPAKNARDYVNYNGILFSVRNDRFTHITEVRHRIENSSSGGSKGGTTINAGGFSHHSGKF